MRSVTSLEELHDRLVQFRDTFAGTEYEKYSGIVMPDPERPTRRPSEAALAKKLTMLPTGD